MTREEIIKNINILKEEKENIKGTCCEVYSRVVGYLRPVQSYNKGKKEEYFKRKCYKV